MRYNSYFSSVKLHCEKWLSRDVLISNLAVVITWFDAMGWLDYICSSHTIYPRLVKMFYANLATSTTCIANSFVLGTPICITPDLVAETLGIPNEGITNFHDIGKTEALGICLEQPNVNPIMNVTSSHLPIASRIILLLVTNTFLPKQGSHTLPSERDLKFVACVKNGTQINLPYLIVNHLLSRPNHTPYPMLLSMIISTVLASFNIDIPDDEQSVKPSHKHLVNKAGLRQLNLEFEEGEWVKVRGRGREQAREPEPVRAGDDDEEEEDDPQQYEMRPSAGAGSSSSRPTLDSLMARLDIAQADIEFIKGEMHQFREGQANILQGQADIRQGQPDILQWLQNTFPQHPPPS
ncbi:hypothetical protein CFOL_v3_05186 [Cephalotus follicularis]|uniref:Putative plant transposon protein domain-containing protein n=1 Tax=Cephalotus follicularis TaxID=3775 RepID=A0A1Q3B113_CEPFO|nr:hypothetical protein CFOL_v3_05186 [Cephalotus follicularis]